MDDDQLTIEALHRRNSAVPGNLADDECDNVDSTAERHKEEKNKEEKSKEEKPKKSSSFRSKLLKRTSSKNQGNLPFWVPFPMVGGFQAPSFFSTYV